MQHRDIFFLSNHMTYLLFFYYKIIRKNWLINAFSNDIFPLMTLFLFVLINQAKYYAQVTGNQYRILGRLICLPDFNSVFRTATKVVLFFNQKVRKYFHL
jgi:hypothetical protein